MISFVGRMKYNILLFASLASLVLVSCDFDTSLPNNGAYDPLGSPNGGEQLGIVDPYGASYTPGSFLQTTSPMTAFYSRFPQSMDQPDKTLPNGVDVKVISVKGSYIKVEVVNTGDVGFVPSVMLGEKRSPNEVPVTADPRGMQVTPGEAPRTEELSVQAPGLLDPSRPAE